MENWPEAWSMTQYAFNLIRHLVPEGKTILELGSGWGTGQLVKYYTVYSIEHNKQWINKYDSNYIYAPIINYSRDYSPPDIPGLEKLNQQKQVGWYNSRAIVKGLPPKYDFIFVDGPNGRIGRGGFYLHLNIFDTSVPIMFDDVGRSSEFILMQKVANKLEVPYYVIPDMKKDERVFLGIINVNKENLYDFGECHENIVYPS